MSASCKPCGNCAYCWRIERQLACMIVNFALYESKRVINFALLRIRIAKVIRFRKTPRNDRGVFVIFDDFL